MNTTIQQLYVNLNSCRLRLEHGIAQATGAVTSITHASKKWSHLSPVMARWGVFVVQHPINYLL